MDIAVVHGTSSVEELALQQVTPAELPALWPVAEEILMRAPEHWSDHFTLTDIQRLLCQDKLQLWLAADEGGYCLAALTELAVYPAKKTARIVWVGGEQLPKLLQCLGFVELWAKREGCETMEILGRRGWQRLLRQYQYEYRAVYLEKDLSQTWEM